MRRDGTGVSRRFWRILASALILLLVPLLGGCGRIGSRSMTGSGHVVSEEKSITGFTRVEAGSAFEVDIRQAESFEVVVKADDNLMKYVEVDKRGDTLRIRLDRPFPFSIRSGTLVVEIAMPELREIRLSGASDGTISGFRSSKDFDTDLSGASSLSGDIEAADVRFKVSGASRLRLDGLAKSMSLDVSGASRAELSDFTTPKASVELSGASSATVDVIDRLDRADLSGASTLYYQGSPKIGSTNISGASTLKRR